MADKAEIVRLLDEITAQSLGKAKPAVGRIATIQAMIDLGSRWQTYSEIHKQVANYTPSQGDYMFELQRKYPSILEKSAENLLRIRPEAFQIVSRHLPRCWARIRGETNAKRVDSA